MNWDKNDPDWQNGATFDQMQNKYNSAEYVLNGPASIDDSYQFGDWISGRMAAKQQLQNQAIMDYAEYVRNTSSAREQRSWEEYMSNTQVQRAMHDLKASGLNPWLAVQSAGFGGVVPQGAVASSSAGQVAGSGGTSSPGSILAGTAVGLAAILKVVKSFLK